MINLGFCKVEIVLVVERNLQMTDSVSDGLCGVCDPVVSRKAVRSATPVSLEVREGFSAGSSNLTKKCYELLR